MSALAANVPFGAYLAALLGYGAAYVTKHPLGRHVGAGLLAAGWLFQTAALGHRWWSAGRPPMSNQFESLVVLAWSVMPLYALLRRQLKLSGMGFWAAALCLLILATASLFDASVHPLMPALQSNWLLYHVAVTMMGYAAFALAAVGAGVYLACYRSEDPLRAGSAKDPVRREKAESLEGFMFRAMSLGFLLLTGGIVLGSVWANEAWGTYWSWDPKETWSLITWFAYAVTIHLRRTRGWVGARLAWLSLISFGAVVFTYFGVNFLLSGLHSYS